MKPFFSRDNKEIPIQILVRIRLQCHEIFQLDSILGPTFCQTFDDSQISFIWLRADRDGADSPHSHNFLDIYTTFGKQSIPPPPPPTNIVVWPPYSGRPIVTKEKKARKLHVLVN